MGVREVGYGVAQAIGAEASGGLRADYHLPPLRAIPNRAIGLKVTFHACDEPRTRRDGT